MHSIPFNSSSLYPSWLGSGGVKDKCLFRKNTGDQYVGRCASCLDQTTKEFAASPPYFEYSTYSVEERIEKKKMVENFIDYRLGFAEDSITPEAQALIIFFC